MTTGAEERYVPYDTLANRLYLVRRELGLTHREAEVLTGVGRGSWQSWESGRAPRDEIRKLTRVADALNIDRDWLMFGGPLRPEGADSRPADTRGGYVELPRLDSNQQPFGLWGESSGPPSTAELTTAGRPIADLRRAIRRGAIGDTDTLALERRAS